MFYPFDTHDYRGVGTGGQGGGGGGRGAMPPMLEEEGGQSIIWLLPNLGGLGPLGLVFFTLENVLCLLFESAIYLVEKSITLITSCNGYRP